MAREKTHYVCSECGYKTFKWLGSCPGCRGWNSLLEERVRPGAPVLDFPLGDTGGVKQLKEIAISGEERLYTGISELDRVMGGGAVPGSAVLVGGDPGIGKSTLLLQAALGMASRGHQVLYVTGEESLQQVKMRAERLGKTAVPLHVMAETDYDRIAGQVARAEPDVVILDSIQTVMKNELGSVPGSVVQVREVTASLVQQAKNSHTVYFIVGHVTKEGTLAGPRLLEHMVDCVLYFEGDRYQSFRVLRGIKNRFGSTNEMGVFTMESSGLLEVKNPSAYFLSQQPSGVPGSAVVPVMEGTRPLLVEIQCLATPSYSGGSPRRTFTGVDSNRVALIIAVLEKKLGLQLYNCDIFVNAVGGVRIVEPAVDLGIAVSMVSSFRDRPTFPRALFLGEIGLTGEVRPVSRAEERIREGMKLGFKRCILPEGNLRSEDRVNKTDLELYQVSTLTQALGLALE